MALGPRCRLLTSSRRSSRMTWDDLRRLLAELCAQGVIEIYRDQRGVERFRLPQALPPTELPERRVAS